jgi:hypothetical protein
MTDSKIEPQPSSFVNRIINSDTLLIVLVPIIVYLLLFFYYLGQYSIFNIPFHYYDFSLPNIFDYMALLFLAFAGYIFFIILENSMGSSRKFINKFSFSDFTKIFVLLVATIPFLISTLLHWNNYSYICLEIFILLIMMLTIIDVSMKKNEKYLIDEKTKYRGLLKAILTNSSVFILLFFLSLLIFSFSIGRITAYNKLEFVVVNTKPECAILATNGNNSICYHFDRNSKSIFSSFIVLDMGSDSNLIYDTENIGPLRMGAIPTPTLFPSPTPFPSLTPFPSPTPISTAIIISTAKP